jgi:hypothetical protein
MRFPSICLPPSGCHELMKASGTDGIVSLQNSHVEALILSVTVFEDRTFKEMIKIT